MILIVRRPIVIISRHSQPSGFGNSMNPQSKFGACVKTLRTDKGWSQERLAAEAKLDRTYIGGIERGERNPSLLNIIRLATALNVSVRDLFPEG